MKKVPMHLQSSQNRILIRGGTVVNAHGSEKADVYIEDRLIKQVGTDLDIPGGTRIIDAAGLINMRVFETCGVVVVVRIYEMSTKSISIIIDMF